MTEYEELLKEIDLNREIKKSGKKIGMPYLFF